MVIFSAFSERLVVKKRLNAARKMAMVFISDCQMVSKWCDGSRIRSRFVKRDKTKTLI